MNVHVHVHTYMYAAVKTVAIYYTDVHALHVLTVVLST